MSSRPVDTRIKFKLLPSQSILLLAALTPDKHTIEIADENVKSFKHNDTPDLVAMPIFIATASRAYKIAKIYRDRGIPVVMGGIHATAIPIEVKNHADCVVIGEADEIWGNLLNDLENNNLKPFYKCSNKVSLDNVPILKRDAVDAKYYASVNGIRTSRGCPYKCKFCYQSSFYSFKGIRHKPIDNVIKEMKSLDGSHVLFLDDNIVGNRKYAVELFREMIPLSITWSGAATINVGKDDELLKLAYDSGCRSLFIGFESINQANLTENTKYQNNAQLFTDMIDNIHNKGIMVNASFIFGLDHDDSNVFKNTVEWIVKNRVETATFHILTPYPGTPLYEEMENAGRIIDFNPDHYNTANVVYKPMNMTKEELMKGYRWAYDNLYSWKNIVRRIPKVKSLRSLYFAFVLGYKKFAFLTDWMSRFGLFNYVFKKISKLSMHKKSAKLKHESQYINFVEKREYS